VLGSRDDVYEFRFRSRKHECDRSTGIGCLRSRRRWRTFPARYDQTSGDTSQQNFGECEMLLRRRLWQAGHKRAFWERPLRIVPPPLLVSISAHLRTGLSYHRTLLTGAPSSAHALKADAALNSLHATDRTPWSRLSGSLEVARGAQRRGTGGHWGARYPCWWTSSRRSDFCVGDNRQ
jgi:hypothetical protein